MNQKKFKVEKIIKRKGDKAYIKWKTYNNSFNSWIDKKDITYVSEYFPKPKPLRGNVKVELDLSNYATRADLKNATWVIHQNLLEIDLAKVKSEVDKLDIDKLGTTPFDLSKLSDVVKNEVVQNAVYDVLVKKVYAI